MARPLRIAVAGGWYHVTARGNERRAIFRDARDRERFIDLLSNLPERFHLQLHAWVLLDNHYHLLIETGEPNLSVAMQWLGVSYTVWFNRRHRRAGHLFQGRFAAILLEESAAWEVSRYVHLNPVRVRTARLDKAAQHQWRAGLGRQPDKKLVAERLHLLRQYRWSSYRAYAGRAEAPEWLTTKRLLALGGATRRDQCRAYRRFAEEPVRQGVLENPWERLAAGVLLGGAEFVRHWRARVQGHEREQPQLRRLRRATSFAELLRVVERLKGERWEAFRDRHGDWGRDLAFYLGRRTAGLTLRALAAQAGGMDYSSVAKAVERFGRRMKTSRQLQTLVAQAKHQMSNVQT